MSEQKRQETNAKTERLRVVTIDGPSGVGKSTVSRTVAAELGFTYLDTGAMYRAVAYACTKAGISADNVDQQDALALLLDKLDLRLLPPAQEEDDVRVLLGDKDISAAIRMPEMSMAASKVSAVPAVRARLTAMQQEMGLAGGLVADGRDTGTVVFPQAAWKFYLDASPEERCRRRVAQLRERGQEVDEQETLAQIIERDRNDQERTIAPLVMAEDAVLVDSSHLDINQVVARMLEIVSVT
ncbi:cytidylate kinase [Candidatus Electrothrix marina]|uniref:Cytidylate kinase n=1 Tax=Candidatus Electrothrix marina TaxID=1859130 RepID=A0A444JHC8_9BACT|nr:cytidylate kinase [Candidatus Electrothrix marina]